MGKLVEKLRDVSQSSGSGFGFLGRAQASTRKPRPAAILVTMNGISNALAEAAGKNGADAVILSGWTPEMDTRALRSALTTSGTVWGVELASTRAEDAAKRAQDAGASFVVLGPASSARALFEEVEGIDRVVTVEPPTDDLALMMLRGQSLLPAQVALVQLRLSADQLAELTVADFTRLQFIVESLRFPSLVTLGDAPDAAGVKTLVHLGVAGLVLPDLGSADAVGNAVKSLREELERTPIPRGERPSVLVGDLVDVGAQPPEPQRKPEREPEREPEHE